MHPKAHPLEIFSHPSVTVTYLRCCPLKMKSVLSWPEPLNVKLRLHLHVGLSFLKAPF